MTRMLPLQRRAFPVLGEWLEHELPEVRDEERVWRAFLDHSLLSEALAGAALTYGGDPIVFVEDLGVFDGMWRRSQPQTVRIHERLVRAFEATRSPTDRQAVESTLLHEMVHWAWGRAGQREPGEKGQDFEDEAYGLTAPEARTVEVEEAPAILGGLSRAWESRGDPGAIGRDTHGGWSYGLYQIASAVGTLGRFIAFLARKPEFVVFPQKLAAAGGEEAGRTGSLAFQRAWRELAADEGFARAQHDFIEFSHYQPFARGLRERGIDLAARSAALRDVAWSTSVQHGPGAWRIFMNPWNRLDATDRQDDRALIEGVYQERSRVDVYFRSSSAHERAAVLARFRRESADALAMLAT